MSQVIQRATYISFISIILALLGCEGAPEIATAAQAASAPGPNAWWDHWPRVTRYPRVADATRTNSNLVNVGALFLDDGRGPWYREAVDASPDQMNERAAATSAGVKRLAWITGAGYNRSIITAEFYSPCDRAYDIDPTTNAPRIEAESANWDTCGPVADGYTCDEVPLGCINPADEVHWANTPNFFAADPIQGSFVWPTYAPQLPQPTWAPLGSHTGSPIGYTDAEDPRTALLYDAVASKDIFGKLFVEYFPPEHTNTYKCLAYTDPAGNPAFSGDFQVGKDLGGDALTFWIAIARETVGYLIAHGADGFWEDNSGGWGSLSAFPTSRAFGDWSVTGFRAYAGTSSTFDIRADLLAQFQTWFGYAPTSIVDANWNDARWLSDDNWSKYKAYKSGEIHTHAAAVKTAVMAQAKKLGVDADNFLVAGNEPPALFEGAFTGDELDMADYEYWVGWSLDVGGQVGHGVPPYGRAGGSYALATRVGRSRHAIVWFYLNTPGAAEVTAGVNYAQYLGHTNLGVVVGYEALASNVLLNGDNGGTPSAPNGEQIVGNDSSLITVHNTIQTMAPVLGNRVRTGAVAVVYSPDTAQAMLAPGGFVGFEGTTYSSTSPSYLDHELGYYGWTAALEELHVLYRGIPAYRLTTAELGGVVYLILPHVRAIEQSTITNVLLPFLAGGGTIVLTGADSGSIHTQAGNYLPNTGPLLVQQLVGQPNVEYRTENPGFDYHMGRLNPTGAQRVNARNLIGALVQLRELTLTPSDPFVLTTEHYDASANHWFIDLVNLDIDNSTDTIHPKGSFTVQWRLPANFGLKIGGPRATLYDAHGARTILRPTVANNVMSFTVPSLQTWSTVWISPI